MTTYGWKGSVTRSLFLAVSVVGCSLATDPAGPRVEVSLIVQQATNSVSSLSVDVGGQRVSLRASDVAGQRSDGVLDAPEFGVLPIQVRLMSNTGDTLATTSFTQGFERDYSYGIGAVVSRVRPVGSCVGTVQATPLRASSTDTLFVLFSGLPSGAVC